MSLGLLGTPTGVSVQAGNRGGPAVFRKDSGLCRRAQYLRRVALSMTTATQMTIPFTISSV
jgi:hypothetical protein